MTKKRVAILISGRGSNMMALVEAASRRDFPAQIVAVISNRPDAPGLVWTKAQKVETRAIDHKAFGTREAFESALADALAGAGAELVCLAGFMRLMTAGFVERWTGRMLNIHPSLLPAFRGLDTHARALAEGVKISGCTVHFVTAEMDAGPIIAQAAVPVLGTDTADTLAARVLEAEHKLYPRALALVASGAARLQNGRVIHNLAVNQGTPLFSPPFASRE